MVRLIDSSPIPLGKVFKWSKWNGRIRGMKLHVVYDPQADIPHLRRDDALPTSMMSRSGAKYRLSRARLTCSTRAIVASTGGERSMISALSSSRARRPTCDFAPQSIVPSASARAMASSILDDAEVVLTSKGDSRLPIPLRRIRVRRDKGGTPSLSSPMISNAPPCEIAALYKSRWQIDLLFRWIKQHLDIRKFLGPNDNAIRLQLLAAMIAYLLLRIAARLHCITMLPIRLAELVRQFLSRADPSPISPSRRQPTHPSDSSEFPSINASSVMDKWSIFSLGQPCAFGESGLEAASASS